LAVLKVSSVWSATHQPLEREPEDCSSPSFPRRAIFHRCEDEIEVRRIAVINKSDRPREIEVTSYAEIVLVRGG
jgi:hypothetical protein